jgi:hypothetical protein
MEPIPCVLLQINPAAADTIGWSAEQERAARGSFSDFCAFACRHRAFAAAKPLGDNLRLNWILPLRARA